MNSNELIESFAEFAKSKNIDRDTIKDILEEVLRAMIRKKFGSDDNFNVIINTDIGDLEMSRIRRVVDDNSEDIWDADAITLHEARKIEADFEVGEEVAEDIKLEDFGRRVILTARQTLVQKVKDLEKDFLYEKYKEMVGEIITAEVYQILGREILLQDSEGRELILPKSEQISKDRFRKGDVVKAVIHKVELFNSTPKITLSRTSPVFLAKLFENEIPEIYDGLITIKKVIREPGERAKVAVESYDDRIDPVGACVGMKGSRIHSIVRELNNESIDVINYTENLDLYISRALSPAKITNIKIEDTGRVSVFLKPDQVSLAIGKGGYNIKLASRLVGMEIDVFRDSEEYEEDEDVDLTEFTDEIEGWVIEVLSKVGLDTAKSVLDLGKEELKRRLIRLSPEDRKYELEDETIDHIFDLLRKEFE